MCAGQRACEGELHKSRHGLRRGSGLRRLRRGHGRKGSRYSPGRHNQREPKNPVLLVGDHEKRNNRGHQSSPDLVGPSSSRSLRPTVCGFAVGQRPKALALSRRRLPIAIKAHYYARRGTNHLCAGSFAVAITALSRLVPRRRKKGTHRAHDLRPANEDCRSLRRTGIGGLVER